MLKFSLVDWIGSWEVAYLIMWEQLNYAYNCIYVLIMPSTIFNQSTDCQLPRYTSTLWYWGKKWRPKKIVKLLFGIKDFAIISSYLCIKKLLHAFLIFRILFLKNCWNSNFFRRLFSIVWNLNQYILPIF